jgi:hypothetical protein
VGENRLSCTLEPAVRLGLSEIEPRLSRHGAVLEPHQRGAGDTRDLIYRSAVHVFQLRRPVIFENHQHCHARSIHAGNRKE